MTIVPPAARPAQTAAHTTSSGDVRLETHGGAIVNILRSSGDVADVARASMKAAGFWDDVADADPSVPDWFSLDVNLRVLADIGHRFGEEALLAIGRSVPEHAAFPPGLRTLQQALASLDLAFHANHRRDGQVMFDPAAGTMLEGIGHYSCRAAPKGQLIIQSTSVYPCSFDRGLVIGFVVRFAAGAEVRHGPKDPCRKRGASSCRYVVTGAPQTRAQPGR